MAPEDEDSFSLELGNASLEFRVREKRTLGRVTPWNLFNTSLEDERFPLPSGRRVHIRGARMIGVDFRGSRFDGFAASNALFERCDFRGLKLAGALFSMEAPTIFRECSFDRSDLRAASPDAARFERCTFDRAKIKEWFSFCGEFVECRFVGRIQTSKFAGRPWGACAEQLQPPRSINEFRGNDFREANLDDVSFVMGIDIGAQLWPEGAGYLRFDRLPERMERARKEIIRWPADEQRQDALAMLDSLLGVYGDDQPDVFTRKENFLVTPARERVWELLLQPLL